MADEGDDGIDAPRLEALYRAHRGALTGYATRIVGSGAVAEEIVADAFVEMLHGRWRPEGSPRSWLYTVVHRRCLDRLRRRRRWDALRRLLPRGGVVGTPADAMLTAERHAEVEAALAELPVEHRAAVLLYYHQGLASKEVARVLDCTDQQVRSRLAYARRRLRDLLEEAP